MRWAFAGDLHVDSYAWQSNEEISITFWLALRDAIAKY